MEYFTHLSASPTAPTPIAIVIAINTEEPPPSTRNALEASMAGRGNLS